MIPYGRQSIDQEDINAVVETLKSDLLTTGPKVDEFERRVADYVGVNHGVAVNSGTAALHAAMFALGIGPGDEVIVPPITFAATANCVLYMGARPVFADVDPDTLLINPSEVERRITSRTRAIIGVDYAGQPCDWDALRRLADAHGLVLVDDACHALGAEYKGLKVGALADMTVFSFHPVKHITTGEGGMVVTNASGLAQRMALFRSHGITRDSALFAGRIGSVADAGDRTPDYGSWYYQQIDLGYNYRITDIQCALGISQLGRLEVFLARRREIAKRYDETFAGMAGVRPLAMHDGNLHAYHLYVVRVDAQRRDELFNGLRERGIGVNVHYIPVHLHPYYRKVLGTAPGQCPVAEAAYEEIISLPIFPDLTEEEQDRVVQALKSILPMEKS